MKCTKLFTAQPAKGFKHLINCITKARKVLQLPPQDDRKEEWQLVHSCKQKEKAHPIGQALVHSQNPWNPKNPAESVV
ncbi:hypothetical protein PK28_14260 [Hymenobacter sp. DG25B]|nr:hypothetical protein PK28_14260 [Hymenobacter sp. DG25B]